MRIGSPLPHKKARIEIIPLIDIMFFLLASFMMVSMTMIRMQSIKMDLPTATQAKKDFKPDIVNVSVDRAGQIFIGTTNYTPTGLLGFLTNKFNVNSNLPVYISGDSNATHGMVIGVLDLVRKAGIQKVSFAINPPSARK